MPWIVSKMVCDSQVIDALLWQQGLAKQSRQGLTVLDMSSSDPVCSRENASRLAGLGIHFVDAPVSGGEVGAKNAALTIMVGDRTINRGDRHLVVDQLLVVADVSFNGNATLAAREAGKHRSEFYYLLKKHGIAPSEFREEG